MTKQEQVLRDLAAVDKAVERNIPPVVGSKIEWHDSVEGEWVIAMVTSTKIIDSTAGRVKVEYHYKDLTGGESVTPVAQWYTQPYHNEQSPNASSKTTPTLEELRVSALYSMNKNIEQSPKLATEAFQLYHMLSKEIRLVEDRTHKKRVSRPIYNEGDTVMYDGYECEVISGNDHYGKIIITSNSDCGYFNEEVDAINVLPE